MSGDYSRIPGDLHKHYAAVLKQQGRVDLDSDWNELVRLAARRWQTQAIDTFGPAAVPSTTPAGFLIESGGNGDLTIGAGRCYVDGLQAEILPGETFAKAPISYLEQPFYPAPPPVTGAGLVYLDVWEREVTAVQDPGLLDVALGGVDTTTRLQTVWQVKLLSSIGDREGRLSCSTDLATLLPPSAGRISTQAVGPVAPTDPCILPDQGGYRGIENRLYRIEIHAGGDATTATWKWSRENASVVSRVTALTNTATTSTISVDRIGRDSVLRFAANDWVEVTDDWLELTGQPGIIAQVVGPPDEASLTLSLSAPLPGLDPTDASRHTRVIRWDQRNGTVNGVLPVSAGWVELEDGVQVQLAIDAQASQRQFHVGDHWCVAARTADASVETLVDAPPLGVRHHYAVLAMYDASSGAVRVTSDCRTVWPPAGTKGGDCACTVCVSAAGHNGGDGTIAQAIEQVRSTGGRVCLGAGVFVLGSTLMMQGLRGVTLSGQGPATILLLPGGGPAIEVASSLGVRVEDLTVLAVATAQQPTPPSPGPNLAALITPPTSGAQPIAVGILLQNSAQIAVERCGVFAVPAPAVPGAAPARAVQPVAAVAPTALVQVDPSRTTLRAGTSMAIALDGFVLETSLRGNVLVAETGVGRASLLAFDASLVRGVLALGDLQVADNWMPCALAGVGLFDANPDQLTVLLLENSFTSNRIMDAATGIAVGGVSLPGAAVRIRSNHLSVNTLGVYCAVEGATVSDNLVTQATPAGVAAMVPATGASGFVCGILVASIPGDKLATAEARVLQNDIRSLGGPGLVVTGRIQYSALADNSITAVTTAGIVVTPILPGSEAILRNNTVLNVATPPQAAAPVSNLDEWTASIGHTLDADPAPAATIIAGIAVLGASKGVVQNNTVSLVGLSGPRARLAFGILLADVAAGVVSGNDVTDVVSTGAASGVVVTYSTPGAPPTEVSIQGNRIAQTTAADLAFESMIGVRVTGGEVLRQCTVSGNCISSGIAPLLVNVQAPGARCLFEGNRCTLLARSDAGAALVPAVELVGSTVIAGNNQVVCPPGIALGIHTAISADGGPAATVLGNLVSAAIQLNGATLGAPWSPLNVVHA